MGAHDTDRRAREHDRASTATRFSSSACAGARRLRSRRSVRAREGVALRSTHGRALGARGDVLHADARAISPGWSRNQERMTWRSTSCRAMISASSERQSRRAAVRDEPETTHAVSRVERRHAQNHLVGARVGGHIDPSERARRPVRAKPARADPLHWSGQHGPATGSGHAVAVAQVVRASGCGPEGRGFESPQSPSCPRPGVRSSVICVVRDDRRGRPPRRCCDRPARRPHHAVRPDRHALVLGSMHRSRQQRRAPRPGRAGTSGTSPSAPASDASCRRGGDRARTSSSSARRAEQSWRRVQRHDEQVAELAPVAASKSVAPRPGSRPDVVLDAPELAAMLDAAERAAHQHDPPRESAVRRRASATCVHGPMPAARRRRASLAGRRRARGHRTPGSSARTNTRACSTSPSTVLTPTSRRRRTRAAHHSATVSSGLSPMSVSIQSRISGSQDRVSSAGSSTGYAERKPARLRASSGTTRWLTSSSDSTSSAPKRSFSGSSGVGSTVGRCSTRPSVRGEVGVGHRVRRGEVDGPAEALVVDRGPDRGDLVGERDPAHPLLARALLAAEPEPERQQHALERAAVLREHDAGAGDHGAHAGVGRRLRLRLPRLARPRRGSRRRARCLR